MISVMLFIALRHLIAIKNNYFDINDVVYCTIRVYVDVSAVMGVSRDGLCSCMCVYGCLCCLRVLLTHVCVTFVYTQ